VGKEVESLKKGIQEKLPAKEGAKDLLKGLPFGK
jgi:hypothetical protein